MICLEYDYQDVLLKKPQVLGRRLQYSLLSTALNSDIQSSHCVHRNIHQVNQITYWYSKGMLKSCTLDEVAVYQPT